MAKQKSYPPYFFPARLTILMEENGYNQKSLANQLGCDRKCIGAWENGYTTPTVSQLYRLCNILHVNSDYLIGLSNVRVRKAAYLNDDFEQAFNEMVQADAIRTNGRRGR